MFSSSKEHLTREPKKQHTVKQIDVKTTVQESVKTNQIDPRTTPFPSFWFFWLYSKNNYFVCFLLQAQMDFFSKSWIFFRFMKFIAHMQALYHAGLNAFAFCAKKTEQSVPILFSHPFLRTKFAFVPWD
jgi:hypothetical protein